MMETEVATPAPAPAPVVIQSGKPNGGIGMAGAVVILGLAVGGYFAYGKWAKDKNEAAGEALTNTEEGQIASALKVIFDASFPSSDEYRRVALRITTANKPEVYRIYKLLTGKNLSDELTRFKSDVVEKANKIENYNSKVDGLFRISPDGSIKFEVVRGDMIRFAPGQTTPIRVYSNEAGLWIEEMLKNPPAFYGNRVKADIDALKKNPKTVAKTVSVDVKPNTKYYAVVQTKEIPIESLAKSDGFFYSLVKPYVATRKVFAAIQIVTGKDPKTGRVVTAWIDARDMVKAPKPVKGLGQIASNLI